MQEAKRLDIVQLIHNSTNNFNKTKLVKKIQENLTFDRETIILLFKNKFYVQNEK